MSKVPPIKLGNSQITFTPAAGALVFQCKLLSLRKDGQELDEISHGARGIVADLALPDGLIVRDIPYGMGRGPSWTRPYITPLSVR